jgi:hypothetical protein
MPSFTANSLVVRGKPHYSSADLVAWALCAASAVFGAWALQVGWYHDILDVHAWRQTHTAISAYEMSRGGPFWRYRTPIFGPPWQWPLELPIYQWLTARVSQWMSVGLEPPVAACRSRPSWERWPRAGRCWMGSPSRLWTSPPYIFWSRTFMRRLRDARTNVVVLANIARLGYPHAPAHAEPFCDLYLK